MTSPDEIFGPTEVPEKYREMVIASGSKYDVPIPLLAAQIYQESGFNPDAVSPSGAIGIAQFMPDTAEQYGVDPTDPEDSINGMAKLMREYKTRFGTWEKALIAYHDGPNKIFSPSDNAKNYVKSILDKVGELIGEKAGQGQDFIPDVPNPLDALKGFAKILEKLRDPAFLRRMGIGALGIGMLLVAAWVILGRRATDMAKEVIGSDTVSGAKSAVTDGLKRSAD